MPIDNSPSNIATSALQGIPFSAIIGAPLNAAVEAQVKAAKSTVDFIQAVGLTGPENDRRPIQIEFAYYADGKEVKLMVPLLTIVPIPYLAIDEVDIRFKASINAAASTFQEDTSSTTDSSTKTLDASVGWGPWKAKGDFNASYSSKKDSKATQESKYSVEYTMDIHVHAGQEDMPAGLSKVLGILEQSITPITMTSTIRFSTEKLQILIGDEPKGYQITGIAYDKQGRRLKDQQVRLTFPQSISGVTFETDTVETDNNGQIVFTVRYDGTPVNPQQQKFNILATAGDIENTLSGIFITPIEQQSGS